jgi:hypothetical protein
LKRGRVATTIRYRLGATAPPVHMIKLTETREITPNGDQVNRIAGLALKRAASQWTLRAIGSATLSPK